MYVYTWWAGGWCRNVVIAATPPQLSLRSAIHHSLHCRASDCSSSQLVSWQQLRLNKCNANTNVHSCFKCMTLPETHGKLKVPYNLLYQRTVMCSKPASIKYPEMGGGKVQFWLISLLMWSAHGKKHKHCPLWCRSDYYYPNILEQLFTPHIETTLKPPCFCPLPNMRKVTNKTSLFSFWNI